MYRWLVRPQSLSGHFGKENKSLALPGIRKPVCPDFNIDPVQIKLFQLFKHETLGMQFKIGTK
jgi:hypothetical protein